MAAAQQQTGFSEADYDGYFLVARDEPIPPNDPTYLRRLLKSLLGMAVLLKRTLVLPRCRLRRLLADGSPSAQPEFVPWSELFDLATLSALHPAIPLESFVASHGRVDLLAVAAPGSCAQQRDRPDTWRATQPRRCLRRISRPSPNTAGYFSQSMCGNQLATCPFRAPALACHAT